MRRTAHEEPPTPAENIEALIDAGTEEGLIQEEDRKLIQSVVEFGDKVVREVMTPRPNIVAISAGCHAGGAAPTGHQRAVLAHPGLRRNRSTRSWVSSTCATCSNWTRTSARRRTVRDLMRPIRFVPETKPVNDLMREMQQDSTHMVIVVDEYGNTAGLATMEDLVEVILGEIRDEHEPGSDVTEDGQGGLSWSPATSISRRLSDLFEFRARRRRSNPRPSAAWSREWLGRVPAARRSRGAGRHSGRGAGQRRAARGAGADQQIAPRR